MPVSPFVVISVRTGKLQEPVMTCGVVAGSGIFVGLSAEAARAPAISAEQVTTAAIRKRLIFPGMPPKDAFVKRWCHPWWVLIYLLNGSLSNADGTGYDAVENREEEGWTPWLWPRDGAATWDIDAF